MRLAKYTKKMDRIITAHELKQITFEEFISALEALEREVCSDEKMTPESIEALRSRVF